MPNVTIEVPLAPWDATAFAWAAYTVRERHGARQADGFHGFLRWLDVWRDHVYDKARSQTVLFAEPTAARSRRRASLSLAYRAPSVLECVETEAGFGVGRSRPVRADEARVSRA